MWTSRRTARRSTRIWRASCCRSWAWSGAWKGDEKQRGGPTHRLRCVGIPRFGRAGREGEGAGAGSSEEAGRGRCSLLAERIARKAELRQCRAPLLDPHKGIKGTKGTEGFDEAKRAFEFDGAEEIGGTGGFGGARECGGIPGLLDIAESLGAKKSSESGEIGGIFGPFEYNSNSK